MKLKRRVPKTADYWGRDFTGVYFRITEKTSPAITFHVDKYEDKQYVISWGDNINKQTTTYSVETVVKYFNDKMWVEVKK
jgi:hypothetical protein